LDFLRYRFVRFKCGIAINHDARPLQLLVSKLTDGVPIGPNSLPLRDRVVPLQSQKCSLRARDGPGLATTARPSVMLDGRAAGHGQLINAALVAIGESEEPRRLSSCSPSMSSRSDEYRQKAAEAKNRAAQTSSRSIKRAFEEVARNWLLLAEQMELLDRQGSSRRDEDTSN
jgi:hypothetical protein